MADTKISALTAITAVLSTTEFPANDAGASKRVTAAQVKTFCGGVTSKALASDAAANSTTTNAKITSLDTPVGIGTFVFLYMIRYQAAAATTGVKFAVNHTGTVTSFMYNMRYSNLIATASDANADQESNLAAHVTGGVAATRVKNTTLGPTLSVDTLNADMLMIIEGLCIVTAVGNIELYHGSEVAAASTVKAGTSLILTQTA